MRRARTKHQPNREYQPNWERILENMATVQKQPPRVSRSEATHLLAMHVPMDLMADLNDFVDKESRRLRRRVPRAEIVREMLYEGLKKRH